jgi:hypothetical protein
MNLKNYTDDERSLLLALIGSPVYRVLLKVANEDRMACLEQMATEKDKDQILRLQGRALGCQYFKNAPKIIAQFEVERQAAERASKPKS